MKVKLMTLMAGPSGCFQPGQVIDVTETEAKALVSGGFAEAVGKWPEKEPPKEPEQTLGDTGTEEGNDGVQRTGDTGAGAGDGGDGAGKAAPAAGRKRK